MKDEANEVGGLIKIDYKRLGQFLLRMFAGIALLNIWAILAVATVAVLIMAFNFVSAFDGFVYVAGLLFIPIAIFCWWICSILTLEFFSEIGIEMHGIARYLVVPIAVPVAALSFIISLWTSVGEYIKSPVILFLCFISGVILMALSIISFM
jgi:hypothetical protein